MNISATETTVSPTVNEQVSGKEKEKGGRGAALADRILKGANELAEFVESLPREDWAKPVSPTDPRTVSVIVHHVASMYPIEIGAVQAIAAGNAVIDVTWEVIAEINANHAAENAGVSITEAVELLRANSLAAAEAVRELTDEELDSAAPFSLSFGAPMTAQFVIEDHPLRHAWHHLARIRKAVGR